MFAGPGSRRAECLGKTGPRFGSQLRPLPPESPSGGKAGAGVLQTGARGKAREREREGEEGDAEMIRSALSQQHHSPAWTCVTGPGNGMCGCPKLWKKAN